MALFQSYAVAIGAAIHKVLFVFCSYPNDDTAETATFDRTVLINSMVIVMCSYQRRSEAQLSISTGKRL